MPSPKRRNDTERGQSLPTAPFQLLWVKKILNAGFPLVIVLLSLGVYRVARLEMSEFAAYSVFLISVVLGLNAGDRKMTRKLSKAILKALVKRLKY